MNENALVIGNVAMLGGVLIVLAALVVSVTNREVASFVLGAGVGVVLVGAAVTFIELRS